MITCDKIIKETKTIPKHFSEKNIICEIKISIFYLPSILITVALLIAVGIYFCLIKYEVKQKHLLPFYIINDKLREVLY